MLGYWKKKSDNLRRLKRHSNDATKDQLMGRGEWVKVGIKAEARRDSKYDLLCHFEYSQLRI